MNLLQQYITTLSAELETPLELDNPKEFLSIQDDKAFLIQEIGNAESILLYKEMGGLPPLFQGDIALELLSANLLLAETRGASFSYNKDTGQIGLNLLVDARQLTAASLAPIVEGFLALAEEWGSTLEERMLHLARQDKDEENLLFDPNEDEAEGSGDQPQPLFA